MNNYTFILAGKFGVGKTAIFNRIKTEEFTDGDNDSNMLIDSGPLSSGSDGELEHQLYRTTINSVKYEVSIWDTGGLEKFRSMTSSYYRYSVAIILVYDSRPDQIGTLFNLEEWIREAKERSFAKERVVLSLWANRWDDGGVDGLPEVNAFKQEFSIPDCLHFRVSAKTGYNVTESLNKLIQYVHQQNNPVIHSGSIDLSPLRPSSPKFFDKCFKC